MNTTMMATDAKEKVFFCGEWVEKAVGEARYKGQVVSAYATVRGGPRYVVDVWPRGFQMICTPSMLSSSTPEVWPHEAGDSEGGHTD